MTRLLLDTHTLLWWLAGDKALSISARRLIADPTTEPLVSTASIWEIAIKRSLGKLTAPEDLPEQISKQGFGWLAVEPPHAWKVRELPWDHRDPFDRILIAQALIERLPVVTKDPRFRGYGVTVHW